MPDARLANGYFAQGVCVSMRTSIAAVTIAVLCIALVLPMNQAAADSSTAVLVNNVLHSISVLTPTGPTDPARVIGVGIGLQGADPAGEAAYIAAEYDPSSPLYGQFLDSDQYEQQFGVPQSRVDAAVAWLQAGGLTVQTTPGVSEYLLASGTVAQVQSLLRISIANYHIDAGDFYANTNAPAVPASLGVIGIAGLNSLEGPRLSRQTVAPAPARPVTVSPTTDMGLTAPTDLWSIYDQPANNKGEGQKMAIFGWGTTKNTMSDLRQFEVENKLPAMPVSITYFGTETAITDTIGEGEWNLDTQASTGMAPNAVSERLYFAKAGTDADLLAAYHGWVGDKQGPLQGSSSFGGCEEAPGTDGIAGSPGNPGGIIIAGNPKQDLYEAVLRRAVAEGRTMFASTGDTGAGCPAVAIVVNGVTLIPTPMLNYPAVSSDVTGVGGTVLYFNDASATAPASRAFEYSWNYTGGGSSLFLAAGKYQNTNPAILLYHCVTDPHGNPYPVPPPLCRGIPDVAAQSGDIVSNGYKITSGGKNDQLGAGTSLSSPLWLGMWTRMQAAAKSKKGNGFANAAIYRLETNPATVARDFFDVGGATTDTAVTCNGPAPTNCSHPGWDYTSGWGTPDVGKLMLDLDGKTAPTQPTTPNPPPTVTPVISGTTCPGPQVVDAVGDAPNTYPGGDGSNIDTLDIVSASFSTLNATTLRVTLKLKSLEAPPPPANLVSAYWSVYWTYNGTLYYVQATSNGAAGVAVFSYSDGTYTTTFNPGHTISGAASVGPSGSFVMDVPLADVGNPPAGAALVTPFADTHGSFTVDGAGLYYTAAADRGPDLGFGASWIVGQTCP
jgi:subtilase family serine protease